MTETQMTGVSGSIPADFSLSVLMVRTPSESAWLDYQWEALGVVASQWDRTRSPRGARLVHRNGDTCHYLNDGFRLQLHIDECESYYHNLRSPSPRCFVIASPDEQGTPVPFLVSLSFDEANAYLEGEEQVFSVVMPPELYRWCEQFVLQHYVPTKKRKRRLKDWRQ
ncbi:MAG: DUF3305 domain-containing protein [Sedimenticola sp.]|nr:DUF3305 domain-containing protein [Sedimenticola sp.]